MLAAGTRFYQFHPCVMVANTKEKNEIYDVYDDEKNVLLTTSLMRSVACFCGFGNFKMKIKLHVPDGPSLVEIDEKMSILGNSGHKYHAKSNKVKIGYFLKVPENPVRRHTKNGTTTVYTDVSYRCYDHDDNELFKVKGEHKMTEIARMRLPQVKMFLQVPEVASGEFQNVGSINYKKNAYAINFPDDFVWPLRLLVIMASTAIET